MRGSKRRTNRDPAWCMATGARLRACGRRPLAGRRRSGNRPRAGRTGGRSRDLACRLLSGGKVNSSQQLRSEVRAIERVVDGLEALGRRLRRGERVPRDVMEAVLAFLTRFVERCHHAKEDALLSAEEGRRRLQVLHESADLAALAAAIERACREARSPAGADAPGAAVAADVMRPLGVVLQPDDTLARAAELMDALAVRELPVVYHDQPVGIVTVRDLAPHRGHFEWTRVRTAMTPDPVTVAPHTPAHSVAQLLLERCFNGVPVVAEGILVGMVTRSDLLRLLVGGG